MISIELVIQEKACDMIRFLDSLYLNITDPAGAGGSECLGTKQNVVEWWAIVRRPESLPLGVLRRELNKQGGLDKAWLWTGAERSWNDAPDLWGTEQDLHKENSSESIRCAPSHFHRYVSPKPRVLVQAKVIQILKANSVSKLIIPPDSTL